MRIKIWILIIVIVLVSVVAIILTGDKVSEEDAEDAAVEEIITPFASLKNKEIIVPDSDTTVVLVKGAATFEIVPGAASRGHVNLMDDLFTEWEEEERNDLATIFTVNTGGTGTFYYLVLFDVSGDILTKKSEAFLGDRINVTRLGIGELVHDPEANYRITVQTLVREEDEPFAASPTVLETRTFYVTEQILEEIEVGLDDT